MAIASLHLWCLALGFVSCDYLLTFEAQGFTIKFYYFLFLASTGFSLIAIFQERRLLACARELRKLLLTPPLVFAILLGLYQTLMAPFTIIPLKSVAYSAWLWFDIFIVFLGPFLILQSKSRDVFFSVARRYITGSALLLSFVTIIDFIAFFYGHKAGLIGYNQDRDLNWDVSRPHAFSYEPSYLGMFLTLCFLHIFFDFLYAKKKGEKFFLGFALSCVLFALVATFSRSSWIVLVLALGVLIWSQIKKIGFRRPLIFGAFVIAACFLSFKIMPEGQRERLADRFIYSIFKKRDGSSISRINSMVTGVKLGFETNLIGTGPGASYSYFISKHEFEENHKPSMGAQVVMSIWAENFAESGLLGTLFLLGFAIAMLWFLYQGTLVDNLVSPSWVNALFYFAITWHLVGNIARTDVWAWCGFWFFSLPVSSKKTPTAEAIVGKPHSVL